MFVINHVLQCVCENYGNTLCLFVIIGMDFSLIITGIDCLLFLLYCV